MHPTPQSDRTWAWAAFGALALCWAGTLWVLPSLPATMAVHWNIHGVADGFMPRMPGALLIPGFAAFMFLLLLVVPMFQERVKEGGTLEMLGESRLWLMLFFIGVQAEMIGVALGRAPSISVALPVMIGLLFMLLGNSMRRVREKGPITMNVPWPVNTPEGRVRLQRAMGLSVMGAGAIIALCGLLLPPVANIAALLIAVFGMIAVMMRWSFTIARDERARSA